MPAKYALHYFDTAGRAEQIRLILAHAGVEYEDVRHSKEEWSKIKDDRKLFPLGQVPVLQVKSTGQVIYESMAIVRFLAREHGLFGNGKEEEVLVDIALEMFVTMQNLFIQAVFASTEEQKKTLLSELPTKLAPVLERFEEMAKNSPDGYLVGKSITVIDIKHAALKDGGEKIVPNLLSPYPALSAHIDKIRDLPNLKKYLESRKPL